MSTKLTLTIDKSVIERAKNYAKSTGRSLSELIQNYLEEITNDRDASKISDKLNKIVGSVKLPKYFDEKEAIRKHLEEKYLS